MNVRELISKFTVKVDDDKLEKFEKKIDKVKEGLEGIKSRFDIILGFEAVKGLVEMAEKFGEAAEQIHVSAEAAGLAVEDYQKLAFGAKQSSVSAEELSVSMRHLSLQLYQARNGSAEAQTAFRQAGFSQGQVNGFKNAKDALYALSDRMAAIPDPIKRAALAQELLGRSGQNMTAYLAKGSAAMRQQGEEAEKLGIILNEHQVQALVDATHAISKTVDMLKGLGMAFVSIVAPAITFLSGKFQQFIMRNREVLQLNFTNWATKLVYVFSFLAGFLMAFGQDLIDLAKHFHMEGDILSTFATVMTLVGGLITLGAATGLAIRLFKIFKEGLDVVLLPLKALRWGFDLIVLGLSGLRTLMAELAFRVLPSLVGEESALAAVSAILEAPLWLIALAIGAIVVAGHDLYALFTGKPTWIGAFSEWISQLDWVLKAIDWIADAWGNLKMSFYGKWMEGFFDLVEQLSGVKQLIWAIGKGIDGIEFVFNKIKGWLPARPSEGGANAAPEQPGGGFMSMMPNAGEMMSSINAPPPATAAGARGGTTNNESNVSIDAPISITMPPGTSPEQAAKIAQDSVAKHFDKVARQINRSAVTPEAY
jgi:hypothetical protein